MDKKRFFLIGPTESVLTKRGNRFPNIAEHLIQNHCEVVYYTTNYSHAEKRFFSPDDIELSKDKAPYKLHVMNVLGYRSNISVRRVISNYLFSLSLFSRLLLTVRRNDVILIPSRPVELIFFIAMLKALRKVNIFIDVQDIWPDALDISNKFLKGIFVIYCNLFLYNSLRHYTGAMHVAPSFELWLRRYWYKRKSSFIPLGWENSRWEKCALNTDSSKEELNLVVVAQLQYQIDVLPVIEAIRNNPNVKLTIIGEDGRGQRYAEVMNYLEANNVHNCNIVGKLDRLELVDYLSTMDIGVSPMITSSIPNKIFDYLGSFLPILVLGENDSADFVAENNFGWTVGFDSVLIENWLRDLTWSEIKGKSMSIKEKRENFSRDQLHQKIKDVITV